MPPTSPTPPFAAVRSLAAEPPEPSRVAAPGPLFAPLVPLYGAAVLARRWAYDHGLAGVVRAGVPAISIGGLEAGGSGKTPVTAVVLRALVAAGHRPGLLTRGYGRPRSELVVRRPGDRAAPDAVGDEPAMLVAGGLDVPIAACPDRAAGARALVALGVDRLVLDDGFQHRRLARDLDIVVLRGDAPLGTGHLLPWGTLREPRSSLRRAGVLWLHYRAESPPTQGLSLAGVAPGAVIVVSRAAPGPARDAAGSPIDLAGAPVVAAAGIARPADFARSLSALGADVRRLVPLRDHYRYEREDVPRLVALVREARAAALVVTEKDAVKLAPLWSGPPLWVLGARVRIVSGLEELAERLGVPASAIAAV